MKKLPEICKTCEYYSPMVNLFTCKHNGQSVEYEGEENEDCSLYNKKEYEPYGEEWKDELMKLPKIHIISLYRAVCLELQESKQK